MCTVTYIPAAGGAFLTSNRDEQVTRSRAMPPAPHQGPEGTILYPRDTQAGGTWTALHENGNVVIFLNGAFRKHIPAPPYRMSRGLVLLTLIRDPLPAEAFNTTRLTGIEPFTAVIWQEGRPFECRWDGREKHVLTPDPAVPRIWSSVTLYDEQVVLRREQWFADWLQQHPAPGMEEILHFHRHAGDGDGHDDLLMERKGKVSTVSITSVAIGQNRGVMRYLDMQDGTVHSAELALRCLNPKER